MGQQWCVSKATDMPWRVGNVWTRTGIIAQCHKKEVRYSLGPVSERWACNRRFYVKRNVHRYSARPSEHIKERWYKYQAEPAVQAEMRRICKTPAPEARRRYKSGNSSAKKSITLYFKSVNSEHCRSRRTGSGGLLSPSPVLQRT